MYLLCNTKIMMINLECRICFKYNKIHRLILRINFKILEMNNLQTKKLNNLNNSVKVKN